MMRMIHFLYTGSDTIQCSTYMITKNNIYIKKWSLPRVKKETMF